jgi:hypothetical protein
MHFSPAAWQRAAAILVLLFSPASQAAAATPAPGHWRQFATNPPQPDLIRLRLNDQTLTLDARPDEVERHFRSRDPDPYLVATVSSWFRGENVQRGLELRESRLRLGSFPPFVWSPDLRWDENPVGDRNWAWRLHSMEPLQFLLAAHAETQADWFLQQCEAVINDWINDNYTTNPPSEFSWSDHSTALRLRSFLCVFEYGRRGFLTRESLLTLLATIHAHASVLADPEFYVEHTNHGLDQSYLLFLAGAAFPEFADAESWRELGRARTLGELSFSFGSEGVHVENSPGYHLMMLRRALEIESMFQHYLGSDAAAEMRTTLGEGFGFAAHFIRPDGLIPILGDSQAVPATDYSTFALLAGERGYQEFRYSISQGREGVPPPETIRVYPQSGYAILRSSWEPGTFRDALHLVFKAGFLSTYHRHDDDLSFVLFNRGEDWIIDSGLYAYQEKDPLRRYVRSAEGHNVLVIDGLIQGRSSQHLGLSRIDRFQIKDGNATIEASHDLYPGAKVLRKLTYQSPDTILLHDQAQTADDKPRDFRVLFHIPTDKIVTLQKTSATVRSLRTGTQLQIRALDGRIHQVRSVIGQQAPQYQGWTSPKYGVREPSICLVFEGRGTAWTSMIELSFQQPD